MRRLLSLAAAAAMFATVGVAAPAGVACAQAGTCHERCQIGCYDLYPGNPSMQQLCTYSCIDRQCGGGDFP